MNTYRRIHADWQRRASILAREGWLSRNGYSVAAQTVLAVDTQKLNDDLYRGRINPRLAVRLISSSRHLLHRNQTRALLDAVRELVDQYR